MERTPSIDLMHFIEQEILPKYAEFDKAHQLPHVNSVIRNSIKMANEVGADIDMCYTIAAYHDLGLSGQRAIHQIIGGKILERDARLKKWFSPHQIKIMKEAVEDHRASASRTPRSIYGKIVAEADRDLTPENVIRRTIQFGLEKSNSITKDEHFQRTLKHLNEKYSRNGYLRLWIPKSDNEKKLKELQSFIENPTQLRAMFDRIFDEETTNKQ